MRFLATSLLLTVSVGLGACANMSTVSRTTWLKPLEHRAIHLDAQQRLVLVRGDKYCAEPSPDALASYAAALGLGIGKPGVGAANVAQALQSNAASIGLRTQSITLMRDTLYRVCEATANGTLGDVGAATALARSQDLTAVVLAIEQLTGAVAAAQVILTSEARAKASTALIETQKRLKAAEKEVTQAREALLKAEKQKTEREKTFEQKQEDVEKAQAALDKAEEGTDDHATLSEKLTTKKQESAEAKSELEKAQKEVESRETVHQEAEKNRDAIQDGQVETRAEATTEGAGQFSSIPIQRNQLDAKATTAIADAVTSMVKQVLDKEYTLESCTALVTDYHGKMTSPEQKKILNACTELVRSSLGYRAAMLDSEAGQVRSAACPLDKFGKQIQNRIDSEPALIKKMNDWLDKQDHPPLPTVLRGCGYAHLRQQLLQQFPQS